MADDNPLGSDDLHGFFAVDVTGAITLLVGEPPQWKIGFYKLSQDISQPGNIGQLRLFASEEALQNNEEPVSERLIDQDCTVADVTGEVEGALFCFLLEVRGERMFFSCKNASDKAMWISGLKIFVRSISSFSAKSFAPEVPSRPPPARPPPPPSSRPPTSSSPPSSLPPSSSAASATVKVDVMKFSERLDCFPELCTSMLPAV
jgi:hypothetical protein